MPDPVNLAYARASRRLRGAVAAAVAQRHDAPRDDIVSELVALGLSDDEVCDEVVTFSLTGYDSVSEALAWTLMLRGRPPGRGRRGGGRRPGARHRGAARIAAACTRPRGCSGGSPWARTRFPAAPTVPGGAKVYLCPWLVHRDPRLWDEPLRFDPARFAPGARSERERYSYFPFGGGSHVCIAETLAMAQVVAVVETITAAHHLAAANGPAAPIGGLTLSPDPGLRVRSAGARA